jgi:hypothetical protein
MIVRPIPEFPQPGTFRQERCELQFGGYGDQALFMSRLDYLDLHGRMHTVMPGLKFDGRSGGPVTWLVLGGNFRTEHMRSAGLHDAGCAVIKMLPPDVRWPLRLAVDDLFFECLLTSQAIYTQHEFNAAVLMPAGKAKLAALRGVQINAIKRRMARHAMYRAVRTHAWYHRNDPACDWRVDFASPEAAEANRRGILGA